MSVITVFAVCEAMVGVSGAAHFNMKSYENFGNVEKLRRKYLLMATSRQLT